MNIKEFEKILFGVDCFMKSQNFARQFDFWIWAERSQLLESSAKNWKNQTKWNLKLWVTLNYSTTKFNWCKFQPHNLRFCCLLCNSLCFLFIDLQTWTFETSWKHRQNQQTHRSYTIMRWRLRFTCEMEAIPLAFHSESFSLFTITDSETIHTAAG